MLDRTKEGAQISRSEDKPSDPTNKERRELFKIAMGVVESLPDQCRLPFVLTQLDGYSYDEASEITSMPRGTVASRVARAKQTLLERIRERTGGRTEA